MCIILSPPHYRSSFQYLFRPDDALYSSATFDQSKATNEEVSFGLLKEPYDNTIRFIDHRKIVLCTIFSLGIFVVSLSVLPIHPMFLTNLPS